MLSRLYRYLLQACILLALSGCAVKEYIAALGENDESDSTKLANLKEIETRIKVIKLWSEDTGAGYRQDFIKLVPEYSDGKIFVADVKGNLLSLDAVTGDVLWKQDADLAITGGPGTGDTLVIVGSKEGDVLAYTNDSGALMWQTKVSSEILAPPREDRGIVVIRTIDGNIFGLDAKDGSNLWIYNRTTPALTLRGTSGPILIDNTVIAGFDNGSLVAIELHTGKLLWENNVAIASGRSELERIVDIDSEPVVVDSDIYVVSFQGRLAAIALESGFTMWGRDISSYAGLTSDGDNLYITDEYSHIWALDRATREILWKQEALYARRVTRPAAIGDFVVVGDLEGYLHWLDKASGQFLARTKVASEPIAVPPIAVEDIVYVYSSSGLLNAYTYN